MFDATIGVLVLLSFPVEIALIIYFAVKHMPVESEVKQ